MADKIKGITIEIDAKTDSFSKAMKELKKESNSVKTELKYVNSALKLDPTNTELVKQKQELLAKQIKVTEDNINKMKKAKADADEASKNGTEINQEEYRRLVREISAAEQELKGLNKESNKLANIGDKLTEVGKKGMAVSGALIGVGAAAVTASANVETAAAKASTLFGDVNVDADNLKNKMLELSESTGTAATELYDGLYSALSAGVPATEDMSEALAVMEGSVKLAKAGFTDTDTALSATVKTINAYKLGIDSTEKIQKILIQTQNKGITTVGELGASLSQVTPTAAAFNVNFENVGASLATMTAQGTATAQATTQLNSLIAELGKNGTIAAKNLDKATQGTKYAGKTFKEIMDSGAGLNDVLALLQKSAEKNGLSMVDMFSSIEAGKAALSIMSGEGKTFSDNLKAMSTDADVVGEAYGKVSDTLQEKTKKLQQTVINLGVEAGDILIPFVQSLVENIISLCKWIGNLNDVQKGLVVTIGALVALLPPLLIVIGKIISAIGIITATGVSGWILGIVAAIGLLTAAIIGVTLKTDKEYEAVKKLHKANMQRYDDYQKNKRAAEEQIQADLSQINHIEKLKSELKDLADENGNVTEANQGRVSFILGELNNALGTEYKLTGDQIEKYGELCNSIDNLILKRKAEIILAGQEESYRTAIKGVEEQQEAINQLSKEYDKARNALVEFARTHGTDTYKMTADEVHRYGILRDNLKNVKEELSEADATHKKYTEDITKYENLAAMEPDKLVERWEKRVGIAKEKGKETGESYVEGVKSTDVAPAGEKLVTDLLIAAQEAMWDNQDDFESIGYQAAQGVAIGLQKGTMLPEEASRRLANATVTAMKGKGGFDEHSPSKKTIPIGEDASAGVGVGIKNKTKQLKEAVKKQAEEIVKTYTDYTKAIVDYAAVSVSRFNIWTYENPNATELEKNQMKLAKLREDEARQIDVKQKANDRLYSMNQLYGESSQEGREALVEYYKQSEALAKIQYEINSLSKTISMRPDTFSQTAYDIAESKYNLWLSEHASATESEKLERQKEMLIAQYEEQGKKVQDVNDKLWDEIQISGETSEASMELVDQLYREKTAYNELAKAISEVNNKKDIASVEEYQSYTSLKRDYMPLLSMGYTAQMIENEARKVSGYTGDKTIQVVNNNYGVTQDTAYSVAKRTKNTLEDVAMQGVM